MVGTLCTGSSLDAGALLSVPRGTDSNATCRLLAAGVICLGTIPAWQGSAGEAGDRPPREPRSPADREGAPARPRGPTEPNPTGEEPHVEGRGPARRDREHLPTAVPRRRQREGRQGRRPRRDVLARRRPRAGGAAPLRGDRGPHLSRGPVLPGLPEERGPARHGGDQRPVLVGGRREVLRVHPGAQARRGGAAHGGAPQQGVHPLHRPLPQPAQPRLPARLGGDRPLHGPAGGAQAQHRRRLARRLRGRLDRGADPRVRPDRPEDHDPAGVHRLARLRALHRRRRRGAAVPLRPAPAVLRPLPHRPLARGRAARAGDRPVPHAHPGARLRHGHGRVRGQGRRAVRDRLPQPRPGLRQLLHQGRGLRLGAGPHERAGAALRQGRGQPAVAGSATMVAVRMSDDPIAAWHDLLEADSALAEESCGALTEGQRERSLFFGEHPLSVSLRPQLVTRERYQRAVTAAETVHGALGALEKALLADADLRAEPDFVSSSSSSRLDSFFADEIRYVEYNAESPAGMAYTDMLAEVFESMPVMRAFRERWRLTALHVRDRQLGCMLRAFDEWRGGRSERPVMAIVDWPGLPTLTEFEMFRTYFESQGVRTHI